MKLSRAVYLTPHLGIGLRGFQSGLTQTGLCSYRRGLDAFGFRKKGEWYYPSSENKGADQLHSYCEADQYLCFRIGKIPVFS